MLETRNLSIHYGQTPAVRDLNLTLGNNEILTLVGPTGCGKTSVLRGVAGLIDPAAGEQVVVHKVAVTAMTMHLLHQRP